jgi:TrpR family transcriptional regulator, trp operon repressor
MGCLMSDHQISGWNDFLKLCQHAKSKTELEELLRCFLTAEERNDIALRIELIAELLKGKKTQREIAKNLRISIAKITRGSNILKEVDPKFKKYLEKELL